MSQKNRVEAQRRILKAEEAIADASFMAKTEIADIPKSTLMDIHHILLRQVKRLIPDEIMELKTDDFFEGYRIYDRASNRLENGSYYQWIAYNEDLDSYILLSDQGNGFHSIVREVSEDEIINEDDFEVIEKTINIAQETAEWINDILSGGEEFETYKDQGTIESFVVSFDDFINGSFALTCGEENAYLSYNLITKKGHNVNIEDKSFCKLEDKTIMELYENKKYKLNINILEKECARTLQEV